MLRSRWTIAGENIGTIIQAVCECGYESEEVFQGGGFESFTTTDMEPAYCPKCKELVVENRFVKEPRCSKCHGDIKFYDHLDVGPGRTGPGFQWGKVVIPSEKCLCPRCGKRTMRFVMAGCWD
jgi:hypothetical protein